MTKKVYKQYFEGSLKNQILGGGDSRKTNIEGGLPKKEGLDSLSI